jgi:hypothetical protein
LHFLTEQQNTIESNLPICTGGGHGGLFCTPSEPQRNGNQKIKHSQIDLESKVLLSCHGEGQGIAGFGSIILLSIMQSSKTSVATSTGTTTIK